MSDIEQRGDLPSEKRGDEKLKPEDVKPLPPVRPLRADALDENPEDGGDDE